MKPRLLFVDDDDTLRTVLSREIGAFGYEVSSYSNAEDALDYLRDSRADVALVDLRLPGMDGLALLKAIQQLDSQLPIVLLTGHGGIPEAVHAMRAGAFDFLSKPAALDELELVLARAVEHHALRRENRLLRDLVRREAGSEILGESSVMAELRDAIDKIARSDANVLILGESGTGKELVARAIHDASKRHSGNFVVMNCGAIPDGLFESELFGHRRGAFTGADRARKGLIELAEGGTLFLDEIGELPPALQAALLRTVQFGEFRPVGADHAERADVRIVAATNRDLEAAVREGTFREDLFHRLSTFTIAVPPLRERGEDVLLLAERFLAGHNLKVAPERAKQLAPAARQSLRDHPWPGNVRELENVLTRIVTLVDRPRIEAADVERFLMPQKRASVSALSTLDLETLERQAVVQALRRHRGSREGAAAELGVATKTLYNMIRRHAIGTEEWANGR